MDINLESLKNEIADFLAISEFAVFRSHSGVLESLPMIPWDSERFPDYRMFLEAAQKAGQKLILFSSQEFEEAEIEEAEEELEASDMPREEQREYTRRIRAAKAHVGSTCVIELAFDYNAHLYVYEARPDWYDDFLEVCDDLATMMPMGVDDNDPDGLGGYYSNN